VTSSIEKAMTMNTKITIEYSNGDTREFTASDELEALINDGEMFSVSTMHSDMGSQLEVELSKMYAGNPMAALGNMIMMRGNAESLDTEAEKSVIIDVLTACIKMLSDETTSHQSGITKINGEPVKPKLEVVK